MNDAKPEIPVIELNGVSVGSLLDLEHTVLEDVNWRVAAGDYWVVAGMHGSGKSDFMAMTGGLMPPQGGSYRLFGEAMPIYEPERLPERLRMGLVFENGNLLHRRTVTENIALPLLYHRNHSMEEVSERVKKMLELTELTPFADRAPGTLGRNWQKRVGLARALMLEPELLLVDNPLGGLDLRHTNWWLNFLGQLSRGAEFMQGRKLTLVVTAEDLRPWRTRAAQFALLHDQRFVSLGERSALEGHDEPHVREMLADVFAGS